MSTQKPHLEILTEELSAEAALNKLLPKIVGQAATIKIIAHQGKGNLLKDLPAKLKAYSKTFHTSQKILVLLDRDKEDCAGLKKKMEEKAKQANVLTKSAANTGQAFLVANRIAIEELEAWFLGDERAVCAAYPKLRAFPKEFSRKNPDMIKNPFETLESILRKAGYRNIGGKIELSRKIATHMDASRNRSASFKAFCDCISACLRS